MASASDNGCKLPSLFKPVRMLAGADVAEIGLKPRLQRLGERARAVVLPRPSSLAAGYA